MPLVSAVRSGLSMVFRYIVTASYIELIIAVATIATISLLLRNSMNKVAHRPAANANISSSGTSGSSSSVANSTFSSASSSSSGVVNAPSINISSLSVSDIRRGLQSKIIVTLGIAPNCTDVFLDEIIEIIPLVKKYCFVLIFEVSSDEEESRISLKLKDRLSNTVMFCSTSVGKLAMIRQLGYAPVFSDAKVLAHLDSNDDFLAKVSNYTYNTIKYDRYPTSSSSLIDDARSGGCVSKDVQHSSSLQQVINMTFILESQ